MSYASKGRSNRLRTIGLRLLSNCNGRSNSAVRNTVVPRQKNLKPRNCGRRRRLTDRNEGFALAAFGAGRKATEPALVAATRRRASVVAGKKLVDRLSTKAEDQGGKSMTSSGEPPPTSWPLGWSAPLQEQSRR